MALPFKVEYSRRPKTKMVDYVSMDGNEYEFHDLLELLQATQDEVIQIHQSISTLKELGIIKSKGSQRHLEGAQLGPQGDEFIKELVRQEGLWCDEDDEKDDSPTVYEVMLREAWEEGMYNMVEIQTEAEGMPQYSPDQKAVNEAWLKTDQKKLANKLNGNKNA